MLFERIIKGIPNTITTMNLLSGGVSVALSFSGRFELAFALILLAAVFDFFDGFSARLLHAYSPLGKELDSLADMVSFGLAPAVMLSCKFSLLLRQANGLSLPGDGTSIASLANDAQSVLDGGISSCGVLVPIFGAGVISFWALVPLLIAAFSGLRLAKFNIDERQSENFIGLATPSCAMILGSMICLMERYAGFNDFFLNHLLIVPAIVIVLSYLLVCEIPMFSFKFKSMGWAANAPRFIFLAAVLVLVIFVAAAGLNWCVVVFFAMLIYLAMNLWTYFRTHLAKHRQ